jgi:hypothetical protein
MRGTGWEEAKAERAKSEWGRRANWNRAAKTDLSRAVWDGDQHAELEKKRRFYLETAQRTALDRTQVMSARASLLGSDAEAMTANTRHTTLCRTLPALKDDTHLANLSRTYASLASTSEPPTPRRVMY